MKKSLSVLLVLGCLAGAANAGTFTSLAIVGTPVVTSSTFGNGTAVGLVNLNTPLPRAYFTLETLASSNAPPRAYAGTPSGATVSVSAQFEIQWKQTTLNEPTPSVLYHHHTMSSVASYTVNAVSSNPTARVTGGADANPLNQTIGGSNSNMATATTNWTDSFAPSWTLVSTDSNGLKTYKATTPTITSKTATCSIVVWNNGSPNAASGIVGTNSDDNFYFDVV